MSNTVAAVVMDETKKSGTRVTTVDRRARGGNPGDGGEVDTAEVITDARWHVEAYMER